ncbi:MAG: hypothetical protein M1827_003247 [Pycnora praestabilis]|nr:MAG: hypothetical protein M1827_003247 [Pycnora praestabilis]
MDVFYYYTYGTAGWLVIQAAPLIISPTMIVTMLAPEVREPSATSAGVTTEANDPKAPYAVPTLTVTSIYHAAIAFYSYARWVSTGSSSFMLSTIGYGFLAMVGLWCLLFASSSGKISRKTGADKRTSGFPFGNKEADKKRRRGGKMQ